MIDEFEAARFYQEVIRNRRQNVLEVQEDVEIVHFDRPPPQAPGFVRQLSEAQVVPNIKVEEVPTKSKKQPIKIIKCNDDACVPDVPLPVIYDNMQSDNLQMRRKLKEEDFRFVHQQRERDRLLLATRSINRRLFELIRKLFNAEYCEKKAEYGYRNFWLKRRLQICSVSFQANRRHYAKYKEKKEYWRKCKFAYILLKNKIRVLMKRNLS